MFGRRRSGWSWLFFAAIASACGAEDTRETSGQTSTITCGDGSLFKLHSELPCAAEELVCPEQCPTVCFVQPERLGQGKLQACVIDSEGNRYVTVVPNGVTLEGAIRHSAYWSEPSTLTAEEEAMCDAAKAGQERYPGLNCPL